MKFYFGFIYYCCFGLAMLYRMNSDFTWHVSTGPEKEKIVFSLFSATPGCDRIFGIRARLQHFGQVVATLVASTHWLSYAPKLCYLKNSQDLISI